MIWVNWRQHRSQAMGTGQRQGSVVNYFVTDNGDKAKKGKLGKFKRFSGFGKSKS